MTTPAGKKVDELLVMLKEEKKVTVVGEKQLYYIEDKNDRGSGNWVSTQVTRTPILYFWCNPQMNRMFAKLSDGREVNYTLGFMDLIWNTFTEYVEEPKPNSWREIFDSKRMNGKSWSTCLLQAKDMDYAYIYWNGQIYSTKDTYQKFPICLEEEV